MSTFDEIDRCIEALHAAKLSLRAYGSATSEGVAHLREIAKTLAFSRSNMGMYGGIVQQVADAIHRGLINEDPPPPSQ